MNQKIVYGDEGLVDKGYRLIAKDITPEQARGYLEFAEQHDLIDKINSSRIKAFELRASEKE